MEYKGLERRACKRVKIPGATVRYTEKHFFLSKKKYVEEFHPVIEISRGGIRFLGEKLISTTSKISLKISLPEEKSPLTVKGRVRWASINPAMSYKYQIGVQFNPYGKKKGYNDPEVLKKIIALEKKFLTNDKSDTH